MPWRQSGGDVVIFRGSALVGLAIAASVAFAPQAQASAVLLPAVQVTLSIDFVAPSQLLSDLTGQAKFYVPGSNPTLVTFVEIGNFDIGTLVSDHANFTDSFIPTEPCFAGGTCQLSFSFGGLSGGFPAFGFQTGNVPGTAPDGAPMLPVWNFIPVDPCFSGGVCQASGPIFGYDDPEQVGTWSVTIEAATPLPSALALFPAGLGLFGWLGLRRRKTA